MFSGNITDSDPRQLMELCVKNGMFTPAFLKEAVGKVNR